MAFHKVGRGCSIDCTLFALVQLAQTTKILTREEILYGISLAVIYKNTG